MRLQPVELAGMFTISGVAVSHERENEVVTGRLRWCRMGTWRDMRRRACCSRHSYSYSRIIARRGVARTYDALAHPANHTCGLSANNPSRGQLALVV